MTPTLDGGNGDKNPYEIRNRSVKACLPFFGCWVLFVYPYHIDDHKWDYSDYIASLGGKYYGWPNGRANQHVNMEYSHKKFDAMLKKALEDLSAGLLLELPPAY